MTKNFKQLVIVCRNIKINWKQFINPIYIGVESGVISLIENQVPIAFICGDFDSITNSEAQYIKTKSAELQIKNIRFSGEKDFIDAELAIIQALKQKLEFEQIVLITEGDRWDMILAQTNLLNKYAKYKPILLTTNNYVFSLKANEKYSFNKDLLQYNYVSLLPLGCNEVIYNFSGCKYYPNKDIKINNFDILSVSNEFDHTNDEKKITVKKGTCLVILYKNN